MKEKLKCWEFFDCMEEECPAYKAREVRCWLVSGTHCRNEIQGKFLEKAEMCLECEPFQANIDVDSMGETLKVVSKQFTEFRKMVEERDRELEDTTLELSLGLSEVFEALKKISSGDPSVRISEASQLELMNKLKHIVNLTAEELAEIVELSHEFAIGLAEHFDALHRVSKGDLTARVYGSSRVELLESLKKVTNHMIGSVSREITERKRIEEELRAAHHGLERRVEERTVELARANEQLKREIEERTRAEEELRRTNEELENFVRVVSHDLKSPIISIQGFSSRLLKIDEEKWREKGRTYLEQIQASSRRMEVFVSELLALSRIGRVVSAFEDVSSLEIVESVAASLHDRLKQNSIKLIIAENLPTIHCDAERIYQVFENLFVNAIKFAAHAESPTIKVGCQDAGQFHTFYVKDNGIGIDPKHHKEIFEMFHQVKQAEKNEGTGLGLAIVGRIVNKHGGKVWVESKKGKGATFYFTLPKAS